MIRPSACVVASPGDPPWLIARTRRSVERVALPLASLDSDETSPEWFVSAGAWSLREVVRVPVSAKPCALIGATLDEANQPNPLWQQWLQGNGGICAELPPSVFSVCLNAAALVIANSFEWSTLDDLLGVLIDHQVRVVRHAALDVRHDTHLRALEVVTSIQRGGAERMVLSLHRELPKHGVASTLCVLGSPTRGTFETPAGTISLKHLPFDSVARNALPQ